MRDVGDWLKDADPVVTAPPPSLEDIASLRAATLNAAHSQYASGRGWPGAVAVALTLMLAFAFSGWASGYWSSARGSIARQSPPPDAPAANAAPVSASTPATSDVRQLQFATPGGTRIIWVFNPDFSL
jgi:hypothetical protein